MYRHDLDRLVELFKTGCATVTISDEVNRYESLDELRQFVGTRIKTLSIQGHKPAVLLSLNKTEVVTSSSGKTQTTINELRTDETTDEADAFFLKTKEYLEAYQQPKVRGVFFIPAAIAFGLTLLLGRHSAVSPSGQLIVPVSSVIALMFCIAFLVLAGYSSNYLSLESKVNSPTFWVRNREDFAKHAVTAVIAGLIGWFLGRVLK